MTRSQQKNTSPKGREEELPSPTTKKQKKKYHKKRGKEWKKN